ncbi:VioB - polyketide synthase [Streptomyces sp. XM4193]|uniref:ferritin-like domain-containing protein n=1 Tax=Streptomyces sp. XM4193 TaxID=2929782 RepID=UPI001FFB30ED|nr:ferritin-like domain-containing protein [Streptomyces sp. XM4193]MCK1798027.1 VioB - polyketide synthase [Streptomyces sp. XM4193]
MSLFDLPRLHFRGTATTHLPTGPRSGLVDLATNTALTEDGRPFPADRPPSEYHDHLDRIGTRYDATGRPAPEGPFNAAKGEDFAGNGHFAVDARIAAVEGRAGALDTEDAAVGRAVDMWGHYNEYLATTVNRARVFDLDPASPWTTTLMVGQFSFGRSGRSHDVGYMAGGAVRGFHPPRWHHTGHVRTGPQSEGHWLADSLNRSVVHQFVVDREDELRWLEEADASPVVTRLRELVEGGGADGLVVQFALSHLAAPQVPDVPGRRQLRGTIAPWHRSEPRTHPAGRLLVPGRRAERPAGGPHNLTVEVTDDRVTLNMVTALPTEPLPPAAPSAAGAPPAPVPAPARVDLGDLELRTADGELVARIPRSAYLGQEYDRASGVVSVPALLPGAAVADRALCLVGDGPQGPVTLLREREVNLQADEAALILEHPRDPGGTDSEHDVEVELRAFVRGRPAPVNGIAVRQFFNPRALPRDPAACSAAARSTDVEIVRMRAGGRDADGDWAGGCTLDTDRHGRALFTLRGARAGTSRLLFSVQGQELPCDPAAEGSARLAFDHDDALGYWSGAGHLSLRVLPDDWHLDGLGPEQADFDLVYREVFAYYEHLYSFMKAEVFSLADRCKVETYAKLIWQMCDPRNKATTYYMPPTRDLSAPKSRLLLAFLRAQQAPEQLLTTEPATLPAGERITTREQLVRVLREAAAIELAVMVQYLYAAYSVPTHGAGAEYVRRGTWTPEQLRLACGDGGETLDEGLRSMLMGIAREEMIHFLLVNNILTAVGEPFHIPRIDFGTVNAQLPVPLDFCLERLGPGSVERFLQIERPEELVEDVRRGGPGEGRASVAERAADAEQDERLRYASLSELYAEIREGLRRVPGLFLVERGRGGGEHHLFLRESVNRDHPDYQLEVDDLSSALFAIDVITEQGEGGVLGPQDEQAPEQSHYVSFLRIAALLREAKTEGRLREPWNPAYPVLRNPTLERGNPAKETVTDPDARAVMELFNRAYFMALQLMVQHFGEQPDASLRRSDLMNGAIDMMTGLMRPLAELLVTMPSGRRGRTAGPSFELTEVPVPLARPDVARRSIAARLDQLAADCAKLPVVPARVGEMSAFWADHFRPAAGP